MQEFESSGISGKQARQTLGLLLLVATVVSVVWVVWGFRVSVPQNKILVLISKFGQDLPPNQILASNPDQKGIQYDVLSEGWHWYSSFLWEREIHDATIIRASELGVLIRQYGKDLPEGQIMANPYNDSGMQDTDFKGVVPEELKPGKYNINPYAYKVEIFPVTEVPAGHVGVVINKVGNDSAGFGYLAGKGEKGVQAEVREPGTFYLNPYIFEVIPYNIRVQKTDFKGGDITFMSFDSYEIRLSASIEWKVEKDKAPLVFTRIGQLKAVEESVIYPYARSLFRIIGSKYMAKDYIAGETRQAIQENFAKMLKETLEPYGVAVSSVMIREIRPPTVLREIINTRGLEKERREKFLKDIEKVKSDAQVAKSREEIVQSQARVEENIQKNMAKIKVEGDREIAMQNANKRFAIAKVNLDVSRVSSDTVIERGRAEIVREFNIQLAQVEALTQRIKAMGGGDAYAEYEFNKRIRLDRVFTNDDSPLAGMLQRFGATAHKGVRE